MSESAALGLGAPIAGAPLADAMLRDDVAAMPKFGPRLEVSAGGDAARGAGCPMMLAVAGRV